MRLTSNTELWLSALAMLKKDVIAHFGSQKAVALALGISEAAVSSWLDEIPRGRAYELQVLTAGKLQADQTFRESHA